MTRKEKQEEVINSFLQVVSSTFNNTINIISDYTYTDSPIEAQCNICKHTWSTTPRTLKYGTGCPKCANTDVHNEFIERVHTIHGDKYKVLGWYTDSHTKVVTLCNTCNNTWEISPHKLMSGRGCIHCRNNNLRDMSTSKRELSKSSFINDIREVHGDTITLLSEYQNTETKVSCKCARCQHVWLGRPSDLKNGHGCPECSRSKKFFSSRRLIDTPVSLYYVYFKESNLWKIGCTNKEVLARFSLDNIDVTILYAESFQFGGNAYKLEDYLLRQFREFKYRGPNILRSGNTELLIQEINFKESLEQAKVELGITNVN